MEKPTSIVQRDHDLDRHASLKSSFPERRLSLVHTITSLLCISPHLQVNSGTTTFRIFKQSLISLKKGLRAHSHPEQPDRARPAERGGIYSSFTQSTGHWKAVYMPELSTMSPPSYTTTLLCVLLFLQQASMEA